MTLVFRMPRRLVLSPLLILILSAPVVASPTAVLAQVVMSPFALSISPSDLTIDQGSSGSATATVTSLGDFSSSVQLGVMGLPNGVDATISASCEAVLLFVELDRRDFTLPGWAKRGLSGKK